MTCQCLYYRENNMWPWEYFCHVTSLWESWTHKSWAYHSQPHTERLRVTWVRLQTLAFSACCINARLLFGQYFIHMYCLKDHYQLQRPVRFETLSVYHFMLLPPYEMLCFCLLHTCYAWSKMSISFLPRKRFLKKMWALFQKSDKICQCIKRITYRVHRVKRIWSLLGERDNFYL